MLKSKRELIQKTSYIYKDQKNKLKEISKSRGEESEHIRKALDMYLNIKEETQIMNYDLMPLDELKQHLNQLKIEQEEAYSDFIYQSIQSSIEKIEEIIKNKHENIKI